MPNDDKHDAQIREIIDADLEPYAIIKLVGSLQNKLSVFNADRRDARAALRAIRKINAGKNQAIDVMCERESNFLTEQEAHQ